MPATWAPMLASPAGDLPALRGWTVEPKWDGIRVVAEATASGVHLWSRNGIDKAHEFSAICSALQALAQSVGRAVLDGELIATDTKGAALRFQAFQRRHLDAAAAKRAGTADNTRTAFVVFDILSADGRDLRPEPWKDRRAVLNAFVPAGARSVVRRGDSYPCGSAGAKRLIAASQREAWEGLIVKQMDATYRSGARSPLWRKVKFEHEQEFVIGGYTLPTEGAARDHFGALVIGFHEPDGTLRYSGKVGTGYTQATLASLGKKLERLRRQTSPFAATPTTITRTAIWVKPVLVAQVRYNEMTSGGVLRQPVFLGLRDDKQAGDVSLEAETSRGALLRALHCGA